MKVQQKTRVQEEKAVVWRESKYSTMKTENDASS